MNKKLQCTLLLSLIVLLTSFTVKAQSNFGQLKAAFKADTGRTYFFTKDKYYRYNIDSDYLENKGGQPLTNWKGLPKDFDASLYNPKNGKYYFFKDDTYYKYDFKKGVEYTGKIGKNGWRGLPINIDAAVVDPTDQGIIHFFKKDETFIYRHSDGKVTFTSSIAKRWPGVPNNINAALLHANGRIYFFKGNKYYKYNFKTHKVEKVGTVGKDGWRGLKFDSRIFPNHTNVFKPKAYPNHKPGLDAAVSNIQHGDVHFFKNAKGFYVKYKRPRVTLLGTRFDIQGFWNDSSNPVKSARLGGPSSYNGVPTHIDAVINEGYYYHFFKGSKYYTWDSKVGKVVKQGNIKDKWSRLPSNLDAATNVRENGKDFVYFFKGNMFFKYNIKNTKVIKHWGYTTRFKDVPAPVDAARTNENGDVITFYRGSYYYDYHLSSKRVYKGKIPAKILNVK